MVLTRCDGHVLPVERLASLPLGHDAVVVASLGKVLRQASVQRCLLSKAEAMIAAYIDELIMACAGLWMMAVGFGYLSLPGGAASQPGWVMTVAGHFKWMGPLLLAIAIALAIAS